jgi:syntaxin-binding protein 5
MWLLFGFPVAGPDRPVPEKPKPRAAEGGYAEWEAGPSKAGAVATSAARTNSDLYNRLHSAVAERG